MDQVEVTRDIEIEPSLESQNIRFPVLTTEQYVDRIIKNLRKRNITHMVRCSVGGHGQSITLNVGYGEFCFWPLNEELQARAS